MFSCLRKHVFVLQFPSRDGTCFRASALEWDGNNCSAVMRSSSREGSDLRLVDVCITQLRPRVMKRKKKEQHEEVDRFLPPDSEARFWPFEMWRTRSSARVVSRFQEYLHQGSCSKNHMNFRLEHLLDFRKKISRQSAEFSHARSMPVYIVDFAGILHYPCRANLVGLGQIELPTYELPSSICTRQFRTGVLFSLQNLFEVGILVSWKFALARSYQIGSSYTRMEGHP